MKLFKKIIPAILLLGTSAIPSNAMMFEFEDHEYQSGDLHYLVTQDELNPMWLTVVYNENYKQLKSFMLPESLMVPGLSQIKRDRPAVIQKIGDGAFRNTPVSYINIPSSVKRIGDFAFYESGITDVDFSEGLVSIGERAFFSTRIKSIKLPESLKVIEYGCFAWCMDLEVIDLPSSLTSLGGFTFRYCTSLKDIYCRAVVPPAAEGSDFGWVPYNGDCPQFDHSDGPISNSCVLHVPAESIEAYRNAPGWQHIYNIVPIEEDSTEIDTVNSENNRFEYSVADGMLTVPCEPNDIISIYDAAGVCLDKTEVTSDCDYRYSGKGVIVVNLNGNSVKVIL